MSNTAPWIIWLLFTMLLLLSTRHPLYLLVITICLFLLGANLAKKKHQTFWLRQNFRFIFTMIFLSTLINTLFTHTGSSVIFTIPENWILIGGAITVESIIYGAINGLVIGSLYLIFNIINLALSTKQLTWLIPTTFHPITMMITVSLTFFPSIQQRAREIKEAQMIRGNPMKKISDWLPLLIPLLVTSLEKAILLSESMTARGFRTRQHSTSSTLPVVGLITATFSIFSGWILSLYQYPAGLSTFLYLSGGAGIALILYLSGRKVEMTRYHKEVWCTEDIIASLILGSITTAWLALRLLDKAPPLSYSVYPTISYPTLHLLGLTLSLVPLLPLAILSDD